MTHTEMEDALNNCNRRLSAVEQILPTLATKADLQHLSETTRRTEIIVESLRDDIHKVAEGYAEHAVKLERLDAVADTVASHTVKLDTIGLALRSLTERLEKKGVI